jgi:ribosome-binding protein aMBF1 (putative translation factor)
MFTRDRLDRFVPEDFIESPQEKIDYEDASAIQEAGLLIEQMRTAAGLSVPELANQLHKSPDEIAKLEHGGSLEGPTMALIVRAAKVCGAKLVVTHGAKRIFAS